MFDVCTIVCASVFSCLFSINAKVVHSLDSSELPLVSTILKMLYYGLIIYLSLLLFFRGKKEFFSYAGAIDKSLFLFENAPLW